MYERWKHTWLLSVLRLDLEALLQPLPDVHVVHLFREFFVTKGVPISSLTADTGQDNLSER